MSLQLWHFSVVTGHASDALANPYAKPALSLSEMDKYALTQMGLVRRPTARRQG